MLLSVSQFAIPYQLGQVIVASNGVVSSAWAFVLIPPSLWTGYISRGVYRIALFRVSIRSSHTRAGGDALKRHCPMEPLNMTSLPRLTDVEGAPDAEDNTSALPPCS